MSIDSKRMASVIASILASTFDADHRDVRVSVRGNPTGACCVSVEHKGAPVPEEWMRIAMAIVVATQWLHADRSTMPPRYDVDLVERLVASA